MNRWKITTAATMAVAGVIIGTAASAESPAPKTTTLDRDAFVQRYDCADVRPQQWSEGVAWLTERHKVKTTVYAMPADDTGLVRKGTNKASAAAISSIGNLRLVCQKRVPFGTRVRWS